MTMLHGEYAVCGYDRIMTLSQKGCFVDPYLRLVCPVDQ